nr:MAG TPA: hypothetical protein [Bacteriophage sp.]
MKFTYNSQIKNYTLNFTIYKIVNYKTSQSIINKVKQKLKT